MPFERFALRSAALAATLFASLPALAADPVGVWINDTGRGAIEIKPCGNALCGHVVWVKDASDADGCGRQIIGDVTRSSDAMWGEGWIYSPEKKKKYNVELTPQADGTLKVKGFAGISFLSKTMIWTKAPADLQRCGGETTAAATPAPAEAAPAPAPVTPPSGTATAPADKTAPPAKEEHVAENDSDGDSVDIEGIVGDIFTRKDGKCKVDTPWVKLDFDCKEKGGE